MDSQNAMRNEYHKALDLTGVLQIRLNPENIYERLDTILTGCRTFVSYDDKGRPVIEVKQVANPKANIEGVHAIKCYVENTVNPQTVQGNLSGEQYSFFISEFHDGLLGTVMENLCIWGIDEDDYEFIVDNVVNLVQLFVSRLIENKERDSYGQTIKVAESNTLQQGKTGLFRKE